MAAFRQIERGTPKPGARARACTGGRDAPIPLTLHAYRRRVSSRQGARALHFAFGHTHLIFSGRAAVLQSSCPSQLPSWLCPLVSSQQQLTFVVSFSLALLSCLRPLQPFPWPLPLLPPLLGLAAATMPLPFLG